jgi:hypothetical protein
MGQSFYGVFIYGLALVGPATAATLLSNLLVPPAQQSWLLGGIFAGIAVAAWFVTSKMFDIRKAQLKYLGVVNDLRKRAYSAHKIEEKYAPGSEGGLKPYAVDGRMSNVAQRDFGSIMAIVMSLLNGAYLLIGVELILSGYSFPGWVNIVSGVVLGAMFASVNLGGYARLVIYELEKAEGKNSKKMTTASGVAHTIKVAICRFRLFN